MGWFAYETFLTNSIFPRVTLRGHRDSVCSVYFSLDEKLLATKSAKIDFGFDGVWIVWSTKLCFLIEF